MGTGAQRNHFIKPCRMQAVRTRWENSMRFVIALLCLVTGMFVDGCKKESPESAVLAQYNRGEDAIASNDINELRNITTPESWALFEEDLKLAREAKADDIKKMGYSHIQPIIILRNRLDPARLRSLSVEDYVLWRLQQGFMIVDRDYGIYPYEVKIAGDTAVIQMGIEIEQKSSHRRVGRGVAGLIGAAAQAVPKTKLEPLPGYTVTYKNLAGYWYQDSMQDVAAYDAEMVNEASSMGTNILDMILEEEREAYGSLKSDLMMPPK